MMKKIIALILCVIFVCVLSVGVSAQQSPVADKVYAVTTIVPEEKADITDNVKPATVKVNEGGTITVTAPATVKNDDAESKFVGFKVYKKAAATGTAAQNEGKVIALANGLVEAVKGTDYDIIKGALTDATVEIKPYTDIVVVANYKDIVIDPTTGNVTVQPESPATGSATAICFAIVGLAAAAVTFGAKKRA